jgi:hypothetical protein
MFFLILSRFRNGIKYAGEIHFVYMNHQTSQMAVLGIFMQSYLDNDEIHLDKNHRTRNEWERYFHIAQALKSENDSITFDFNYTSLMGENLDEFWRYHGSLTTPPCTEGIIWTMFKEPIVFMESQFKALRDYIYFEDYRGPQPLYNRKVFRNFPNESVSTVPDYNRCLSDLSNERNRQISSILSVFNCSTSTLFLWLLTFSFLFTLMFFAFCKSRHSIGRKKFE